MVIVIWTFFSVNIITIIITLMCNIFIIVNIEVEELLEILKNGI